MKSLYLTCFLIGAILFFESTAQTEYFSKRIHFDLFDVSRSVLEIDSGYLVCGSVGSISEKFSLQFIFLDTNGNITKKKEVKVPGAHLFMGWNGSLVKVEGTNPGYALAGTYEDSINRFGYIVRLDKNGDTLWTNKYISDSIGEFYQCKATSDGGLIAVGRAAKGISVESGGDFWLVKTDEYGNIQWEKKHPDTTFQLAQSVGICSDGGYILGGQIRGPDQPATTTSNFKVVKTDNAGNLQWSKQWGVDYDDGVQNIEQTKDGGFIVSGHYGVEKNKTELYLARLNANGDFVWEQTYGSRKAFVSFRMVHELEDGSFIACGSSLVPISASFNGAVVKVAANGDQIWFREHRVFNSTSAQNWLYDIKPTKDGGFIASGWGIGLSPDTGNQDIWVLKLDSLGCAQTGGCPNLYTGIEEISVVKGEDLKVYPNPANKLININFNNDEYLGGRLVLYTITGTKAIETVLKNRHTDIDISHLAAGNYVYRVSSLSEKLFKNGKLVVVR